MLITDLSAIGTRLREIRKSRKLSQAEVAAVAGISVKAYADIERGTSNMRVETMLRICQTLCISPDVLFIDTKHNFTTQQQELLNQLDGFSDEKKKRAYELLCIILELIEQNHSG